MRISPLLVALACFALALPARAEPVAFAIDESNSTITFKAPFMEVFELAGAFHDFSGRAVVDDADPDTVETEMKVRTEALTTDDGRWEDHLRGESFFASEEFPEMTFRSTALERRKGAKAVLKGELTLRGITRKISLDVEYTVRRTKGNRSRLALHGITELDRRQFGMTSWEGVLGDTVTIEITADVLGAPPSRN